MAGIDLSELSEEQTQVYVRTLQIILNRFGMPGEKLVNKVLGKLEPAFPAESAESNWLLCETLAYLQSPRTAGVAMDLISRALTQEEKRTCPLNSDAQEWLDTELGKALIGSKAAN